MIKNEKITAIRHKYKESISLRDYQHRRREWMGELAVSSRPTDMSDYD